MSAPRLQWDLFCLCVASMLQSEDLEEKSFGDSSIRVILQLELKYYCHVGLILQREQIIRRFLRDVGLSWQESRMGVCIHAYVPIP